MVKSQAAKLGATVVEGLRDKAHYLAQVSRHHVGRAIIGDPPELAKIINWAQKQEMEPLMSVCARSPLEPAPASKYNSKFDVYAEDDTISSSVPIRRNVRKANLDSKY